MKTLSAKTGFWSAAAVIATFSIWIICFSKIAVSSDIFTWTNFEDYVHYFNSNSQLYQNLAKLSMLFFGPAFFMLIVSYEHLVPGEREVFAKGGTAFALAFAILSTTHYFVQMSAVRFNLTSGDTTGLDLFVQANPFSVMTSVTMTGWTLFLGLASFLWAIVFKGRLKDRKLHLAFLSNGIFCFLGFTGYMLQIDILTFFSINLGVGGSLLMIAIESMLKFRKMQIPGSQL